MTSSEKKRSSAYSEDIRWRMVWQKEALQISIPQIAKNLCVDKSTVSKTLELFYATGEVSKKPYPKEKAHRKITAPVEQLIFQLVLDRPGILLREIQSELDSQLYLDVSVSGICRFLHANGFTHQRLQTCALQRNECLRQQYITDMSVYSPEMLIFVDETGTDRRNTIRKCGYSMRGKPLKNYSLLVRGERISAIACISVAGLIDVKTIRGTSDGDVFL